jgi:uncharacterized protein
VQPLDLLAANLLSPLVLCFVLGVLATALKSDLKFPDELYTGLSIYLLLAIGLKGGAELSATELSALWRPTLATVALGCAIPLWCFWLLRRLAKLSVADAAALAAHYGSVSVVTFLAALSFLDGVHVAYEGFLPALVAMLEVPAILIALGIARLSAGAGRTTLGAVLREVVVSKSVFLLLGGLLIGLATGKAGLVKVAPFFVEPFQGALALFLLEMGMVAARRARDFRRVGLRLTGFALLMPLVHGALGVALGKLAGLSMGGGMVLGVMAATASYIAAPAAVRVALPEANPGLYLTASLAITFPFNLAVGIPYCYAIARLFYG